MTTPTIRTATAAEVEPTIAAMVLAFSADPPARWGYPDPQQYLIHYPNFVKAFGGQAFAHQSAYYLEGYAGAALWLPPAVHPDEDALIALLRRTVAAPVLPDILAVLEQMSRYHPSEPHWYLSLLGVDPLHQNQGYGSALLRHALISCGHDHTPAYLESSNPRNIPLYERHGFELLGAIQVGTSPPLFPMRRRPR